MAQSDAIDAPQLQPAEPDRVVDANLEEPKKVMCSFLIFASEVRKSTTEELGADATRTTVFTRMSEKWKELPESDKEIYNQKHAVAKSAYEAAMDAFKAAGGQIGERKAKNKAMLQQRRLKAAKRKGNKDAEDEKSEDEKSLEVGGEKPLKVRKIEPTRNIADTDLLQEAKKCGLNLKLAMLADRPEVKKLGVTMRRIFDVLKASEGKVVVSKKKLVSGSACDEVGDDKESNKDEDEDDKETPD